MQFTSNRRELLRPGLLLAFTGVSVCAASICVKTITVPCSDLIGSGPAPVATFTCWAPHYEQCGDIIVFNDSVNHAIYITYPEFGQDQDIPELSCTVTWYDRFCSVTGRCIGFNPPTLKTNYGYPSHADGITCGGP